MQGVICVVLAVVKLTHAVSMNKVSKTGVVLSDGRERWPHFRPYLSLLTFAWERTTQPRSAVR